MFYLFPVVEMFFFCPPQVKVLFAGQDIDKSPFMVNVAKAMGDSSKVHARGPGLEPVGNVANKPTYFDIYTAGENKIEAVLNKSFFIQDGLLTVLLNSRCWGWRR